jgi:PAS domain S-box-containing protein
MKDQKFSKDLLLKKIEELEKENQRIKSSFTSIDPNNKLEGFFNIALDLFCIADNDGNFIWVNKSWEKTLGYSSEYLVKHKFLEFVHPDDLQTTLIAMKRLENKEQVLNFVNRYRCKDGNWKYIEWRSHPVGELIYAAARDISERINFEKALMASEERFALVIDATELGVWDWNVETDQVYYSPQWKMQVGYEDHELKNEFKTWQDLLHQDDYDRMHEEISKYLANPEEHFVAEFRLRHKNGNYIWIHNKASAKKNSSGKVVRFFGSHSDITDRKISEILLKEKNEQIEAQNEEYKQLNEELYYAKEAIEKSEKKFRNLVESAFDGIYLIEGRNFSYVNPRFTEITGYSFEEITDKEFNFEKLLTQGSKEIVEERYNARKRGEITPSRYEFQILTKNREIKDVEVSTVQVGKEGEVIIMGIM